MRPAFLAAVLSLTLIGAGLRWAFLNHPMRYDEAYNYLNYASRSPAYIATHYVPNNHILHTLLVRAGSEVLGTTPAALRLPAFLAGVLLIPATAWLAWQMSRRRGAVLLATLAVCGSSALVEYSASARGYSMLSLMTVLACLCAMRLLRAPTDRRHWVIWGVVVALGAYTVPVMVLPALSLAVVLLLKVLRLPGNDPGSVAALRGWFTGVGVGAGLTALLYLPVAVNQGADRFAESAQLAYQVLGGQIDSLPGMIAATWKLWTRDAPLIWVAVFALGLLVYAVSTVRTRAPERWLPLAIVGVSLFVIGATRAPLPPRAWMFALPVCLVCSLQALYELCRSCGGTFERGTLGVCAVIALSLIAALPLAHVARADRLCAEPGGLVEVEDALDGCRTSGSNRCALIARYSPATNYYLLQKGMPPLPLPTSPQVERAFIVADAHRRLGDLWHPGIEGFSTFGPPRVWRRQALSTVYVTERLPQCAAGQ